MDSETLMKHVRGELPVDAVVAAVDPDAPGWRESFDAHVRESSSHGSSAARFRKNAPLSLQLRLIRKNMPWIRNIYVAVADLQHFATEGIGGMDLGVYWAPHDCFIPQKQLPVFNSYAIEWYLHRIPGLAPTFIYFNDDFYPTAPSTMADFVDDAGRTFLTMRRRLWGAERTIWDRLCRRTYDWAKAAFGDPGWPSSPCHAPRLWFVDENEETLQAALAKSNPPAARFRNCGEDLEAIVAFCLASAVRHGWNLRPAQDYLYTRLERVPAVERAVELWAARKFTCVNDGGAPLSGTGMYKGACARLAHALEILSGKKGNQK